MGRGRDTIVACGNVHQRWSPPSMRFCRACSICAHQPGPPELAAGVPGRNRPISSQVRNRGPPVLVGIAQHELPSLHHLGTGMPLAFVGVARIGRMECIEYLHDRDTNHAIRPEFIRDSFGIHSGFIVRAYFNLSTGHLHLQGEVAGRIGKEDMERTKEEQQVSGLLTSVSEWKLA
jgi:hypothetical protein